MMKYAALLAVAGLVAAQDFTGVPECAIPCLQEFIPQVGCSLTDTACQCDDAKQAALTPLITSCLFDKCSSAEVVQAADAASKACAAFLATASGDVSVTGPATTATGGATGSATGSATGGASGTGTAEGSSGAPTTTGESSAVETGSESQTGSATGAETSSEAETGSETGESGSESTAASGTGAAGGASTTTAGGGAMGTAAPLAGVAMAALFAAAL